MDYIGERRRRAGCDAGAGGGGFAGGSGGWVDVGCIRW